MEYNNIVKEQSHYNYSSTITTYNSDILISASNTSLGSVK